MLHDTQLDNWGLQVLLLLFTITTLIGVAIHYFKPNHYCYNFQVPTAITCVILSLTLIVSGINDKVSHYSSMFQAWSDLRIEVDAADAANYKDLRTKVNFLNSREPYANIKTLEKFQDQEERSRGIVSP